eukprot:CAMPEP_0172863072 /NCGR_PEP_ID=MMETSP1075-20121228/76124_1 /TAXON_ID=2916 /ORGANISM="Ceratium fusus, Strain PA161109" /LENGTH=65 /DNA_ID=CAMNT_0013711569 /DNA_START=83 /DNA_END=280 /DNA_ORIENTATION=+
MTRKKNKNHGVHEGSQDIPSEQPPLATDLCIPQYAGCCCKAQAYNCSPAITTGGFWPAALLDDAE